MSNILWVGFRSVARQRFNQVSRFVLMHKHRLTILYKPSFTKFYAAKENSDTQKLSKYLIACFPGNTGR